MVGVDNSNVANVGVSVDADATTLAKLKASICYFAGTNYVFVTGATASFAADGTTNISISNFPLDSVIFTSKYFVVVWEDNDGSGTYNPADDPAVNSSSWCQIVFADQTTLANAYSELNAIQATWATFGYPDAANFLVAFMEGTAPSGITSPVGSKAITPNYVAPNPNPGDPSNATLHHNTGVAWTSATAGTIPLYIFNNGTTLSEKIQANTDFRNTIKSTMTSTSAISDVQSYNFESAPDHWFHWNGPTTITFNHGDLYYAIRHANLSGYVVWVRVQAGTLKVLQVAVYGNVNCIYSFNFDEASPPFQFGALLQSGYLGPSNTQKQGQVFYYQVSFNNGNIDMPYTYPPP
jgi:hypothetical protein